MSGKRFGRLFAPVGVGVCAVLAVVAAAPIEAQQGPPAVPVQVAAVTSRSVSDQIAMVGDVEPVHQSMVAAEVSGRVESFPVHAGDFVEKGAPLARLKSKDLAIRLAGAVATREKIRAGLVLAEKELQRVAKLMETRSVAETRYDEAFHHQESLAQELRATEAEIEHLEYQIAHKTVEAPFAGFVAAEHTQVGQWINPGGPVVTLIDLADLWVTVDVPERYAVMLSPGEDVTVLVKSVAREPMAGRIYAVLPQGNPESRTFPVRIRMQNPAHRVRSGMEALVYFNLTSHDSVLLVPKDAVVTAGDSRMVYVVDDGRAVPRNVTIKGFYGGDVAVEGGLRPGDPVVIRGNERLFPNQPVTILE